MIKLPRLNAKQQADLKSMMQSEGWKMIVKAMETSIELSNAELINWSFPVDDDGEPIKKRVLEFREKRIEVDNLKKFLHFLYNPTKIVEESLDD